MEGLKHQQFLNRMRQRYAMPPNIQQYATNRTVRIPSNQNDFFYQTPVKIDKVIQNQGQMRHQIDSTQQKIKQMRQKRKSVSYRRQIDPDFGTVQSSNIDTLRDKLLQKEKILTQRMKENQRALLISKQLRKAESTGKYQSQTANQGYQKGEVSNLYLQKYSSIRNDKTSERQLKSNDSTRNPQISIQMITQKAEAAFRDRINCIMSQKGNKNSKYKGQTQKTTLITALKQQYQPRAQKQKIILEKSQFKREERENNPISLQNTSKMHERIRALLLSR